MMTKKKKVIIFVTSIVIILPIIYGLFVWNQLPESIATHFGVDGEPNGWSNRYVAVIGLPLSLLAIHLICAFASEKDMRRRTPAYLKNLLDYICPIASLLCGVTIYGYALGCSINMPLIAIIAVIILILFTVLPLFLSKK